MSVKKDLDDAKLSALSADEVNAAFDEAIKKALDAVGASRRKNKFPHGVYKLPSGKFQAKIRWGDKTRYIGTFDTPEQASAAYGSVGKDRDGANLSSRGGGDANALFDIVKKKAVEAVGASRRKDRLPKGVYKTRYGKFMSRIMRGGKKYHIGMFDTPEQASAAYMSVKIDLKDANLSTLSAEEVDGVFDAAKKNAMGAVQAMVDSDEYSGKCLVPV